MKRWSTKHVAGLALLAGTCACVLTLLASWWLSAPERQQLDPALISAKDGAASFIAFRSVGASVLIPSRNASGHVIEPMQLFEDGRPIGRIVDSFDDVAKKGGGRFAYAHPVLAFSTSDGSDPRTNSRSYILQRPMDVRPVVWFVVLASALAGLALAFPQWTRQRLITLLRFGPGVARVRPISSIGACASAVGVIAAIVLIVVGQLLLMWWHGVSAHVGVAGYLPVSDALGYYGCAVSIAVSDAAGNSASIGDWCARRVLYPSMLSALLGLSGWHPSIVLLTQAVVIGVALGVFVLALKNAFGWVTALLSAFVLLVYVHEFAVGLFMTEALAMPCGLIGLALLILSARDRQFDIAGVTSGFALISLGMAIRPGAVLVLPLLGIWLLVITHSIAWKTRAKFIALGAAALVIGPALHFAMILALGGDPANAGGNFSTSLYGLSTGSRDWSEAYRDFNDVFRGQSEKIAFQTVQQAAVANIEANPGTFVRSLLGAGADFSRALFAFGVLTPYNTLATALFLLGLALCMTMRGQPKCLLLLLVSAGELLSAPLVYDSGYHRVFAVTVAARATVLSCGAAWIVGLLVRPSSLSDRSRSSERNETDRALQAFSFVVALVFFALAILPATPAAQLWSQSRLSAPVTCGVDQREIVLRPGRESMRMTIGRRSLPLGDEELGSASGGVEVDPVANKEWWSQELPRLADGFELIYAVQRSGNELGVIVPAFSQQPLLLSPDQPVTLCLARYASVTVKLGDYQLHEVVGAHFMR